MILFLSEDHILLEVQFLVALKNACSISMYEW